MKKFKKLLSFLMVFFMGLTLAVGCNDDDGAGCDGDMTLEQLNKMLNDSENMNMDLANAVAIIPFNHINGPRNEWKFYALVNFQFKERNYVKYQVTYLSCTCRAANVNYWQTAYVELSLTTKAENAKLRTLSFDKDAEDHYIAGFWGDSSPIYSESDGHLVATYEKMSDGNGGYYPSIKHDFIPLLVGKTKAQIDSYNVMDDMESSGVMTEDMFDSFTGASVSTNNILRILHALFKHHTATYYDAEGNIKTSN